MMATTVMGIDLGTQGIKAIIYDPENKTTLHSSSAPFELIARSDGTREQLAQWWIDGFHLCIAAIPDDIKKSIRAIGVSGQQHGFVPLDANGEVLSAVKLWCDTSTSKECEDLIREIGGDEQCFKLLGGTLKTGYTLSKIRWLKDHHPEIYQRMATILLPHDYLNFYLTGNRCMEYGDASGTGLLNVRTQCWSPEMIHQLDPQRDLTSCLPQLINPQSSVGKLRAELAKDLGLSSDVIVSAGGGDNMMAAIGTGNVVTKKLTASLGTSGTLFAFSDKPLIDPQDQLASFCSSTGGWLPLLCTMNCTTATENIRNLLKLEVNEIERLAASIPIGSEGVLTLPFYHGERVPNLPNGKAVIFGLDHNNTSNAHLIRSAMESAVFGLKNGLLAFERCGLDFEEVTLTGGGSSSPLWRQICADVFNLPVKVLEQQENAAFGAALQSLWCLEHNQGNALSIDKICDAHLSYDESKTCVPNENSVNTYNEIYKQYTALIEAVTPLY